jgi:hypothetical protein
MGTGFMGGTGGLQANQSPFRDNPQIGTAWTATPDQQAIDRARQARERGQASLDAARRAQERSNQIGVVPRDGRSAMPGSADDQVPFASGDMRPGAGGGEQPQTQPQAQPQAVGGQTWQIPAYQLDPNWFAFGASPAGAGQFGGRMGDLGNQLSGNAAGALQGAMAGAGQMTNAEWESWQRYTGGANRAGDAIQQLGQVGTGLTRQAGSTYGQAEQALGQVGAARDAARMAMQGQGPSLAQAQLRQGTDAALAAQLAASQSGPGGWSAAGQRSAAMAGANVQAQAAAESARLRMQEQLGARDQFGALAGQYAGQLADIGSRQLAAGGQMADIYGQQAALQQAQAQQGLAAAGQASSSYLAGLGLQGQLAQGALGQAAGLYGLEQTTALSQAELYAQMQQLQMEQYLEQLRLAQAQAQYDTSRNDTQNAEIIQGVASGVGTGIQTYQAAAK